MFSVDTYPMLHQVIPAMDILNAELEAFLRNPDLPAVIRRAIQRGLIVLDKYYALTDASLMWKTAMCK